MTTDLNRDPADTNIEDESTDDPEVGTSGSIDWESNQNPYKNKFSGEQSRSSRLQAALEEERANRGNMDDISSRLESIEELVAKVGDRATSRASRSDSDLFDDDDSVDDSGDTTGTFEDGIRESRKARSVRDVNAQATKVWQRMNSGWLDGMNMNDPEMVEVSRLYNGALEDPAKRGDLDTALVLYNAYSTVIASRPEATASSPPPTDNSEGDGEGDDGADGSNNANDPAADPNEPDPPKTARQRNRDAGVGQGQDSAGGAVPRDISNLTPMQKFALHEEGASPSEY